MQRSRTATPRSQRKYVQPVWANRALALLGHTYVDRSPSVSPHRDQHGTPIKNWVPQASFLRLGPAAQNLKARLPKVLVMRQRRLNALPASIT
jgi:hypothetical protein